MVDDAYESGLSGSVWPQQTIHRAARDVDADVVKSLVAGVILADTDYFKDIVHCLKFVQIYHFLFI